MTTTTEVTITHPDWCTKQETVQVDGGYLVIGHQSAPHSFHTGFDDDRAERGSLTLRWFEWMRSPEHFDPACHRVNRTHCPPFIAGLDEYGDVLPMHGAAELAHAIADLLALAGDFDP